MTEYLFLIGPILLGLLYSRYSIEYEEATFSRGWQDNALQCVESGRSALAQLRPHRTPTSEVNFSLAASRVLAYIEFLAEEALDGDCSYWKLGQVWQ
jgi:hypothetical protein